MKKLIYIVLAAGILLVWSSGIAMAEGLNNYASFKIGRYHMSNGTYDKPIGFELAVGRMLRRDIGLELGYGRYELSDDHSGYRPAWLNLSMPALGSWRKDETLTISPLTLTLRAVSSNDYSVAYVGGGIGAYFVDYEARFKTKYEGNGRFNESDTVYGIHLETGIGYNTLENVFLGVGLRLTFTDSTHMRGNVFGLNAIQEDRLNGYIVTGEVSYRF